MIIYKITLTLWIVVLLFSFAGHAKLIDIDKWPDWMLFAFFVFTILFAVLNVASALYWIWW